MKAKITGAKFINEWESKYGIVYSHLIEYDGKKAYYNSKSKDQTKFIVGEESEFTEEEKEGKKGKYLQIKPTTEFKNNSNYSRAVKKEASKYSGFAASYIKDLLCNGILKPEKTDEDIEHNEIVMITWKKYARSIFEHMALLDKTLES